MFAGSQIKRLKVLESQDCVRGLQCVVSGCIVMLKNSTCVRVRSLCPVFYIRLLHHYATVSGCSLYCTANHQDELMKEQSRTLFVPSNLFLCTDEVVKSQLPFCSMFTSQQWSPKCNLNIIFSPEKREKIQRSTTCQVGKYETFSLKSEDL